MAYAIDPVSQKEDRLGGFSLICLALGIIGPFFSVLPLGPNLSLPKTSFVGILAHEEIPR
jgi:hypothetical protein